METYVSASSQPPQITMLIIHNNFYSPQLDRTRTIRVLLPRNYQKEVKKRFPVIYLQDGQNLFEAETAAFGYWKLQTLMARQPLMRQAILVGIDNAGIDRTREYAPFSKGRTHAQGDLYLQFIEHTVKPFIDQTYRTWGHRDATGIVGSSMGGLIAFYAGMRYNHAFGKVGVLSPSFWYNPKVMELPAQVSGPKSQIYISASKKEMRSMAGAMEHTYWTLKDAGFADDQFQVVVKDRGQHTEAFWSREFKGLYEWLYPTTV